MAAGIATVQEHRAAAGRADLPFSIGALSGPLHLANTDKVAGYLRGFRDLGCHQVQVGFKSTSADDLCDQIARFAAEVAPLVND
jgi:hypothetical protein